MYVLIDKASKTVISTSANLPPQTRIPGRNDVVFSASPGDDIGPDHILIQATLIDPAFDPATEVKTGPAFVVADDFSVTERYTVRAKTAQELAEEEKEADDGELRQSERASTRLLIETVDHLIASSAMSPADLSPVVRADYQRLRTIVDRRRNDP